MGFTIANCEEVDAILGECPLCYAPVHAAELELQEYMHYSESRIKVSCRRCQVTFDIETRTWRNEQNYRTAWPAIEVWNKLSSPHNPRPEALNKIRARHDEAKGVERSILAEVLKILEE